MNAHDSPTSNELVQRIEDCLLRLWMDRVASERAARGLLREAADALRGAQPPTETHKYGYAISSYLRGVARVHCDCGAALTKSAQTDEKGRPMTCWGGHAVETSCGCYNCSSAERRMSAMIVCPKCGNKRCPRGTSHLNDCTGSNEPGQIGSRYRSSESETGSPE